MTRWVNPTETQSMRIETTKTTKKNSNKKQELRVVKNRNKSQLKILTIATAINTILIVGILIKICFV